MLKNGIFVSALHTISIALRSISMTCVSVAPAHGRWGTTIMHAEVCVVLTDLYHSCAHCRG